MPLHEVQWNLNKRIDDYMNTGISPTDLGAKSTTRTVLLKDEPYSQGKSNKQVIKFGKNPRCIIQYPNPLHTDIAKANGQH